MNVIEVHQLTKDYGGGKGVLDVSFAVERGEVFGFLGPNGAGKTTMLRHLMGFIRPQSGSAWILNMGCFAQRAEIQKHLGYLPGETAFMDDMTGWEFIRFIAKMKGMADLCCAMALMKEFELDGRLKIRRMSKGTKQKIAIVCAFMHEPEILLLDEPTSGLDPLMQNQFVELVRRAKARGATILLSSHLFEEVEKTCDRTAIIRAGRLAAVEDMERLQASRRKLFRVTFEDARHAAACAGQMERFGIGQGDIKLHEATLEAAVTGSPDPFIKELSRYTVLDLQARPQTLEEIFLHFYATNSAEKGGNQK